MNRIVLFPIILLLSTPACFAQATPPESAPPPNSNTQAAPQRRVESSVALRVEVSKTIDAKKAKAGDPVVVKTVDELMSGDKSAVPRGTKIYGHVVSAKPHQGDSPSTLEIAFDKLDISAQNQLPLRAVVQALSKPIEAPAVAGYGQPPEPASGGAPMGSPAGGRMGGGSPPTASTPNSGGVGDTGGMPGQGASPNNRIPLNAQGVIGTSDISLSADAQGNTTITSQKHNVKLESGAQMVLKTVQ